MEEFKGISEETQERLVREGVITNCEEEMDEWRKCIAESEERMLGIINSEEFKQWANGAWIKMLRDNEMREITFPCRDGG